MYLFISSLEDNKENELVTCALAVQCQCSGGRPDASRLKCIFLCFVLTDPFSPNLYELSRLPGKIEDENI